jgi:hypothetical protein
MKPNFPLLCLNTGETAFILFAGSGFKPAGQLDGWNMKRNEI